MRYSKENIQALIDKYFEGLTSLEEEQLLRDFFQQGKVDEEFEELKPMFRFFAEERKNNKEESTGKTIKVRLIRWISVAACLILLLSIGLFLNFRSNLSGTSSAYIDGKKYTDIELIQIQALNSLENMSEGEEDIFSSQIEILESFTDFFE